MDRRTTLYYKTTVLVSLGDLFKGGEIAMIGPKASLL
jgi:hypothetical protein